MKKILKEQFTENNYTMEDLVKIFKEKSLKSRKDGITVEFIT